MVEEQVEVEGFPADFKRDLAADERKAAAQLEQKIAQMVQQAAFELPLMSRLG